MVVLFIDERLTTLTVTVEIIEKVNNTYRTATSEMKREMHAVSETIQLCTISWKYEAHCKRKTLLF